MNSIESLLRKNEVDSSMVCALLDSVSGVDELRRLGSRLPPARSVSHVCSAEIYCDCFLRACAAHAIQQGARRRVGSRVPYKGSRYGRRSFSVRDGSRRIASSFIGVPAALPAFFFFSEPVGDNAFLGLFSAHRPSYCTCRTPSSRCRRVDGVGRRGCRRRRSLLFLFLLGTRSVALPLLRRRGTGRRPAARSRRAARAWRSGRSAPGYPAAGACRCRHPNS